jgi:hypothetical protein
MPFIRVAGFVMLIFAAFPAQAQVTFSKEISRILQGKCQRCHRPDDIAPFALQNYQDAATWAADIKRVVADRIMPPWKPVPEHGDFRDNYGLSEEERQMILDWIEAGTPEGDPAELPEQPPETGEWQLGEPDAVLQMAEPYTPPRQKDVYRCFVLPGNFDENKFVQAVQVVPGNRQVVHHVLLFLDTTGEAERLDAQEEGPGYTCFGGPRVMLTIGGALSGWVPGLRAQRLPDGIAVQVPARTRVVMQVHYFPGPRPGPDQTRIGLYYSRVPVERRLVYIPIVNLTFRIPPGAADHEVNASFMIPPLLDAKAILIAPHMHLLGRKIRVDLEVRNENKPMIRIDDWDFNWQGFYTYVEPVKLPAFSTVNLTCRFDNSENNPRNPNNPLRTITWGEGTEDEMCLAFLGVTFDYENLLPFQKRQ